MGETFTILTASSVSGTFSTVNGIVINGSEYFEVTYNHVSVVLTVESGQPQVSSWPSNSPLVTRLIPAPVHHGSLGKGRRPAGERQRQGERRGTGRLRATKLHDARAAGDQLAALSPKCPSTAAKRKNRFFAPIPPKTRATAATPSARTHRVAFKAGAQIVTLGDVLGQDLAGYGAIESCVAGLVHLAQAAGSDRGEDFVKAELIAC